MELQGLNGFGFFLPIAAYRYIQVLRPIYGAGLLRQRRGAASYHFVEAVFMKTPLRRATLRLETDGIDGHSTQR